LRGKGYLLGLFFLAGIGAMIWLMARDIRQVVSVIPGRDPEGETLIQMRNARIHKMLSEDSWIVEAPLLEKEGEILRGYSLDLRMEGPRGRGAFFFAEQGTVDLEKGEAALFHFQGSLWGEEEEPFEIVASRGRWKESERLLFLEEGFVLSSDEGTARGESAVLHQDRTVEIRTKAVLEWEVPE